MQHSTPVSRVDDVDGRARTFRLASPTVALVLGLLVLVLAVAVVPLSILAHRFSLSSAILAATSLVFAVVAVVVARHQPRNLLGWLLLGQAGLFVLSIDAALYAVLHFRRGYDVPLGWLGVLLQSSWAPGVLLLGLAVLVLPDGHLPSPRWRFVWWPLVVVGTACTAGAFAIAARAIVDDHLRVEPGGAPYAIDHETGVGRWWATVTFVFFVLLFAVVLVWLIVQLAGYRRASGERRLQLKWLLGGAAIFAVSAMVAEALTASSSATWQDVGNVVAAAQVALPICMGVAILRFRLYEIDRLISRTVTYAIVTGLLVGVFVAVVTLSNDVLPFSSPVGVAASTLTVAALFNPLRRRVQHAVDRRFNRARYDAEELVAAFATRLQYAVDLDTVRDELLRVVARSLEPSQASLWTGPSTRPRA